MQIITGNNNSSYHLYQNIVIKMIPSEAFVEKENILYKFREEMKIQYKNKSNGNISVLELDYSLYVLLKKVIKGYIPSMSDKRVSVRCADFIKKISRGGSKMESIIIRDLSNKEKKEYRFEYDQVFGYSFEEM